MLLKNQNRNEYEQSRVFKCKTPMAKLMLGLNGKVHHVKCKICSKIEGKKKLLAPKLDNLWKHGGMSKILVIIPNVCKVGEL